MPGANAGPCAEEGANEGCGERRSNRERTASERAALRYVGSVVLPLWMGAGALDYFLHRRVHIERNTGSAESRLHLIGIALTALPVLAGLLLEINAGVIAAMSAGYVMHAGMTVWDVGYADERRPIVPLEQHTHALLELLPFTALSLVVCAHREQALALAGRGEERADFSFAPKREPLSPRALAALAGGFALCVALPFVEELARCLHYERKLRDAAGRSR